MAQHDFSPDELKSRRDALCAHLAGASALIPGAPASPATTAFRQYNDFYYLCGIEVPHAYLFLNGETGTTRLFLPPAAAVPWDSDDRMASADDPDYAAEISGADEIGDQASLEDALRGVKHLYTPMVDGEGLKTCQRSIHDARRQIEADPWDGRPSRGTHQVERIRSRFPALEIRDITPILLEMRMLKSAREIELLRRAGQLAAVGLREAIRATRPGVMEYELAAVLQYEYLAGGALDTGYTPIVAGGPNAFHGHYHQNSHPLNDGDMILVDCAPDYRYYTSDITRMWPVSGRYSPAQRALYGFVTEYHKTLLGAIRPGRTCEEIEEEAVDIMSSRVDEFDFATEAHARGPERMFQFRKHLAHSVGMSVHDGLSHKDQPLRPGMVFAVDPQMKIPEDRLYLRVEDTGVVTEDGFEVLTRDVPLELDDLEALMTGDGLIQAFPPAPTDSPA